jgi:hypothetical protein
VKKNSNFEQILNLNKFRIGDNVGIWIKLEYEQILNCEQNSKFKFEEILNLNKIEFEHILNLNKFGI